MNTDRKAVFVIEDDPKLLEALLQILELGGYLVAGTTRWEQGTEWLGDRSFDLIIVDVMLSGMDGRDLVRRLRTGETIPPVPVLMMSAMPGVEASSIEAGADAFLAKPFGVDELLEVVLRLLDGRGDGLAEAG